MAEYIERGAALRALCEAVHAKDGNIPCRNQLVSCLWTGTRTQEYAEKILAIPAADVRPVVKAVWKHVKWVVDEEWQEGGYWISRCSNCLMPYHTETLFCPHCGADMREES